MTKIQQWKRCNPLGENLISQLLLEVGGWDADGEDLARRGLRTGNFWWATKITFWNWVWPLTPVAKVLKSTTRKTLAVLMEFKTISFWDKICLSFWWMSWVLEWSTKGNLWLKPQLAMDSIPRKSGTVCLPQKTKILVANFPVVAPPSQVLNYLPIFHDGGGLMRKLFCVSPHKNMKTTSPRFNCCNLFVLSQWLKAKWGGKTAVWIWYWSTNTGLASSEPKSTYSSFQIFVRIFSDRQASTAKLTDWNNGPGTGLDAETWGIRPVKAVEALAKLCWTTVDATSSVFWPTGELTGTSCRVDSAAGDGLLETSAGDKRRETSSATRVIRVSINCGDNMDCTDSFEWVGTAGSDATVIASTCGDRFDLAGTARTAALLAWTLARGLLRFVGPVEVDVRRLDLAFGMITICNPKGEKETWLTLN